MSDIAPPTPKRWYVDVDSKVYGPYNESAISQMVERGQILPGDFVAPEGSSDWIEAKSDPILRRLLARQPTRTDSAEPPVRRKRNGWGGKLAAIIGLATAGWVAWPYYAVLSLMQAARDGDVSTLEKRVDWTTFRQGLRGDLNAQLLQNVRSKDASNATANGLAAVVGPAVINQMIDGYVTPQAIAALVKSENDKSSGDKTPEGIDKSASLVRRIQWDQVKYAFFAGSPFSFRVDILPNNDSTIHTPIGFEFAWSGDWQLKHIALPEDVFKPEGKRYGRPAANETTPKGPPATVEPPQIAISMQAKRFKPTDVRNNEFEAAIVFDLSIVNKSKKPIRAFDGLLTFTDLLDNEVLSTKLAINDPINDGSTYNWTGQIKYNQFMDDHNRLKNEDLANLKTRFTVRKILFADGTSKTYP
ncbi:DUF2939 domain-containing protein [Bradyrhizobium sp. DASA03005]|uniref:DUF2939 domain-containing protein n=1 Tax=Bradyrhizobium sp. SPXBL-02 TaxID=3395912 RepID=UPI003F711465